MKVLLKTYLTTDGCERLCTGDNTLWYWYFSTIATHVDDGKGTRELPSALKPPAGMMLCQRWVGVPELNMVRQLAVQGLREESMAVRTAAEEQLARIQSRIQDLLALTDQREVK